MLQFKVQQQLHKGFMVKRKCNLKIDVIILLRILNYIFIYYLFKLPLLIDERPDSPLEISSTGCRISSMLFDASVSVGLDKGSTSVTYRVCKGFRSMKQGDYFRVDFDHLRSKCLFEAAEIVLKMCSSQKQNHLNQVWACPNLWNAQEII